MIGIFITLALVSSAHCFTIRRHAQMSSTINGPKSMRDRKIGNIISIISVSAPLISFASAAKAGFFESDEQSAVNEISKYQRVVNELLEMLRPTEMPNAVGVYTKVQTLKGNKEDSDVVLNYAENYFKPCQSKMAALSPKLKLEGDKQNRVEVLPSLMKGHLLELGQAIDSLSAESQAKEVEEIQETLAEFLLLASSKYAVTPFVAARVLSDKELFGPLGCEFWGKKRVPGSNACYTPEDDTK